MSHLILSTFLLALLALTGCGSGAADEENELSVAIETEERESQQDEPQESDSPATEAASSPQSADDRADGGHTAPNTGDCPEVTDNAVAEGKQLFVGRGGCITCHASDATGSTLGPDLTDNEWINIDPDFESIVYVIRNGIESPVKHPSPMPAMGGAILDDDQICKLAAYVWSLKK